MQNKVRVLFSGFLCLSKQTAPILIKMVILRHQQFHVWRWCLPFRQFSFLIFQTAFILTLCRHNFTSNIICSSLHSKTYDCGAVAFSYHKAITRKSSSHLACISSFHFVSSLAKYWGLERKYLFSTVVSLVSKKIYVHSRAWQLFFATLHQNRCTLTKINANNIPTEESHGWLKIKTRNAAKKGNTR